MNLIGMVKHSQISQNCKFAMSIQYLRKEVRDEMIFYMKYTLNFLQVVSIVFDGSDQTCPNYPK